MSQPKLSERINKLEDAILEIKTILEQKDNLTDLIAQLRRNKTVTSVAPVVAPESIPVVPEEHETVALPSQPPVPAPSQITSDFISEPPTSATGVAELTELTELTEFQSPSLPSKPSLVMVLASLSPSSTANEQKLIKRYKKYIDDFLEENPTPDEVEMDYRLLALTMEFVSAAEKELRYLTNSKENTRVMSVAAVIWLLQTYQEYNNKVALNLPVNLSLLIHTVYDMLSTSQYIIRPPETVTDPVPKTKKVSKWGLHWSTIKKRWTQRKDPGCLP